MGTGTTTLRERKENEERIRAARERAHKAELQLAKIPTNSNSERNNTSKQKTNFNVYIGSSDISQKETNLDNELDFGQSAGTSGGEDEGDEVPATQMPLIIGVGAGAGAMVSAMGGGAANGQTIGKGAGIGAAANAAGYYAKNFIPPTKQNKMQRILGGGCVAGIVALLAFKKLIPYANEKAAGAAIGLSCALGLHYELNQKNLEGMNKSVGKSIPISVGAA